MRPNSATVMPVRAQEHEERFHEQGEAALGPAHGTWTCLTPPPLPPSTRGTKAFT